MSSLIALSVSLVLLFVALPLVSLGTTGDNPLVWWLGLGCLVIGGLIPPVRRFMTSGGPEPPPSKVGACDDARC